MDPHSAMRRVLMLARHFPPIGGAGVHRSVGYARYLPHYGYRPVVITGPGISDDPWSPRDPDLLGAIPADTEVHRLRGQEPPARNGWHARADRLLQRPQPWVPWWVEGAVEEGLRVGEGADLVLASCLPYETAGAAAKLAASLGVPWVADLEDPWALDEMRVHSTGLHQRLDLARMRSALSTASAIVMCAPEAAARVRRALPEHEHTPVAGIPIGFDAESFDRVPATAANGRGDAFRIVHTGSLHTELGLAHRRSRPLRKLLRGTSVEVDILTRSALFLLEAIERVLAADPALRGRIELHLAGDLSPADRAEAEKRDFVRLSGRLTHSETIGLMRSADLLFLPMHELPPGHRAGLIPYKTYEYLAAERPILAAIPDGDVRDMLAPLDHVTVCRPSDVDAMAEAIRQWVARGPVETVTHGRDSARIAELERRRLTGRLAAVFDEVLARASQTALPAS